MVLAGSMALAAAPQTPPADQAKPKPAPPSATTEPAKPAPKPAGQRVEIQPVDIKWLDRIPKDDRAAFDELLGYAPPAFTSDLQWIGGEAPTWDGLRGKVVVIQSFTTADTAGRGWPARVANALESFTLADVRVIALHTPEQADGAKEFLAKKAPPQGVLVAVDSKGAFCDALAIYKHPTNLVIDRNGALRFAALNVNGLEQAVKQLVAEPFKPDLLVASRGDDADVASPGDSAAGEFPPFTGTVDSALDIRGKRAPEFHVAQWLNGDPPNATNKVVVVDFWATWCGPCVASIPHMNDLAEKFRDDVLCVGISDENKSAFDGGLAKLKSKNITLDSFKYHVALDPSKTMYNPIQIRGIPHCIVMDRNWIVRWQGHPATLDAATLEKIVRADKGGGAGGGAGGGGKSTKPGAGKRKTWT